MQHLSLAIRKTTGLIDRINDRLTSYRLMLYFLLVLVAWSVLGSLLHKVFYNWYDILLSFFWLTIICRLANQAISKYLNIPASKESDIITGSILTLILPPAAGAKDWTVLAIAGITAIAAKYVITYHKSHIFNPAAAGAFIAGTVFHYYPSWWVGTKFMTPLVFIGGLLVLRKMKRFSLALVFLAVFVLYLVLGTSTGRDLSSLWLELTSTQVLFFAVVMLPEPLTSPAAASRFLPYGVLVGVLYSVTKLRFSPEEALLIGNLVTFIFARNRRWQLKFVRKIKEAEGIYSYVFSAPPRFKFTAGQYMEWTLAQHKSDTRGNRRYFTVASAPTENNLMVTVKQPEVASAFKQKLSHFKPGDTILAARLAGNFTLPKDPSRKLAFLAGGVGITPFRSIVKYLIDKDEARDIALLYSANSEAELAFSGIFGQGQKIGLKTTYLTGGRLDKTKIKQLIPDYKKRSFYVSGPYGYVTGTEEILLKLGVKQGDIITDYFPGYG